MVRIRLKRMGRTHRPFYRISAMEGRNPRDGRVLEDLGHYDPVEKNVEKQIVLKNPERVQYWLDNGATASETVKNILKKQGIVARTK